MWLLLSVGVGVGLAIASAIALPPAGIVVPLLGVAVALGVSACPGRPGRVAFVCAVGLLGVVRGASIPADAPILAERRGAAPTTRSLRIVGASTPGPRCRVQAATVRGTVVPVALPSEACPLAWGDLIRVPSSDLYTDTARSSPDGSDAAVVSHAWRRPSSASSWASIRSDASAALARTRQAGWEASRGDPARGFVVASSLGLTAALAPRMRARLQEAGLGHLIAISGLHVGLAAWIWLAGFRWVLAPWRWGAHAAVVASSVPVAAYVVLTGAAPPAVRASIMFALVAVGSVIGRPTHGPSVLIVAVALMVFVRPQWIVAPGFQLSVAAMVVLVSLPAGASASFTTWHLGWALLPLLWLHFDANSDGSVIANAVAVPVFVLWVVPTVLVGWGLFPFLGAVALDPAAAGAAVILDVAQVVSGLPEVPRGVWVGLAAATWVPALRRHLPDRVRAWLPHRGAALLLLVVGLVSLRPSTPRPGWTAWSTGREPEVLAVSSTGAACVRAPSRSARRWQARLEAAGVQGVDGAQPTRGTSILDPALSELFAAVRSPDVPRGVPPCSLPDRDRVRAALSVCRSLSLTPAARRLEGSPLQCWSAQLGAWRPAPIHLR